MNKTKKYIAIGAISGALVMWLGPNIVFYFEYGISTIMDKSLSSLTGELWFGELLMILIGTIIGGLIGYRFETEDWES